MGSFKIAKATAPPGKERLFLFTDEEILIHDFFNG
jgi:hypothetical protein